MLKKTTRAKLDDKVIQNAILQVRLGHNTIPRGDIAEAKMKKITAQQNKKKKLLKNLLVSMETEQGSKGKSVKPKTGKGKKLENSAKRKIVNDSDDENCVRIYCLKPYKQSKKSTRLGSMS